MDHSHVFFCVFLAAQVLVYPNFKLSLSLAFLEEGSVARVGIEAFLEGLDDAVKESTEAIAKFVVDCLKSHKFL